MPAKRVQALLDEVKGAQQELDAQLDGITPRELYTPPREGEWTVAQVLAHLCESLTLRMSKVERVLREENTLVDRTPEEREARLRAVEEHGGDRLEDIRRNLSRVYQTARRTVRSLRAGDLDRRGRRATGEEVTLEEFLRAHLVRHVLDHARQVAEARQSLRPRG